MAPESPGLLDINLFLAGPSGAFNSFSSRKMDDEAVLVDRMCLCQLEELASGR